MLDIPFWLIVLFLTEMENGANFLTKVQSDWAQNLSAIQDILREGERIVTERTSIVGDPLLDSPNIPNFRGYLRWVIMPKLFESAISSGKLIGLASDWVSLGGVHMFEMQSQFTRVTLYHMRDADETPRESIFRKNGRTENALCPDFFAIPEDGDELMHILLAYGKDFAQMRAYYDKEFRSRYRQITPNIMQSPTVYSSFDAEPIADPEIEVKFVATFKKAQNS